MTLLLDSLRVENYRIFKRLEIERLGRANLFVGKNNCGKSSVLEAVRLYVARGGGEAILSILEAHDELTLAVPDPYERFIAVRRLFHGRDSEWSQDAEIRIGPANDQHQTLSISIRGEADPVLSGGRSVIRDAPPALRTQLALVSSFEGREHIKPLDGDWRIWPTDLLRAESCATYVSPNGLSSDAAARLWDLIALTELEQHVIEALRVISPDIERISFIEKGSRNRIAVAKLESQPQPVPMRSLGDGVNRMLGIALSLASAAGGVLLIDEIENGIHFKAQRRLWELIFRLATVLETQVFATTHSWDCIKAFQRVAALDPHEEAVLVRLDLRKKSVLPVTFSEHDLEVVTREQIEVR